MNEQEEFFTPQQERLLSIAVWVKYLAWIVLVVYVLWAAGTYIQQQTYYLYYGSANFATQNYTDFMDLLKNKPLFGLSVFMEIIGAFLRGVMYFLILHGISLGLNMIVETDINYREQKEGAE
jgi:hypothetical protein